MRRSVADGRWAGADQSADDGRVTSAFELFFELGPAAAYRPGVLAADS
jgi:hypothetical protein